MGPRHLRHCYCEGRIRLARQIRTLPPEELLALEIVITVAIIAIPLFFAPVIPITPGLPNQERSEQAAEENQPVIESIFAWSIFRAERFIHGYKDDLIAVFTIVLAWSTIGLWIVTERTLRHIVAYGKESIVRGALQICTHGNHAN